VVPFLRLIIFVPDVEASAGFYESAFGFKRIPSEEKPSDWLELETGAAKIAFHKAYGEGSGSGDVKLVFHSEDVPATVAELESRGVKMGKVKTFGTLVLCDGTDLDGHKFQISNRG
jgi:catechol 2,3-dioxygenase-like lactoylglutathione lyase family enzyme